MNVLILPVLAAVFTVGVGGMLLLRSRIPAPAGRASRVLWTVILLLALLPLHVAIPLPETRTMSYVPLRVGRPPNVPVSLSHVMPSGRPNTSQPAVPARTVSVMRPACAA